MAAGERARLIAEFGQIQRALPPAIVTAKNGPYLVTNVPAVRTPLGDTLTLPPQLALCRCGASATKPFCDGTHASNGFTDAKDPNRVPDQRDTYPGQQVTVFDNRGICQHSGLCTDRVATVFRTGAEPFVAPSGGRLDEIVRAVRDCPSGALSLAFDDTEARDLADWHASREAAIEVTQDGPYRVTGGIGLADATGADVPRAAGSSREHYALCRCGHSQNKPFCSGMHWYVEFRDPARGGEPTLFEWAGGLPALTRMTRLLYEKHVPADDLLAPLFATMAPGYPEHEAAVLAEAFGGPPAPSGPAGHAPQTFAGTEAQRARWVALATQAADEAQLPADPAFRSAFTSYLEWSSRAGQASPPQWDWGPAGPPSAQNRQRQASTRRRPAGGHLARTRRASEFRGARQAAVPRARPQVDGVRLRPVVAGRRAGARGRHPRAAAERHDALRRRLAARQDRDVQALDGIRLPALGGFMRFLVICRPAAGGDQVEFKRLVPAETAALRDLKAAGTLTDAWSPGRPGAVLMLDVPDADEAARLVGAFPWSRRP